MASRRVIAVAVSSTFPPLCAVQQDLVGRGQYDDGSHVGATGEHRIQPGGLIGGTWETVEHEAIVGVRVVETLGEHCLGDGIGYQLTGPQSICRELSHWCFRLNVGAENVSRGNMWDVAEPCKSGGLSSFAGVSRAEHQHGLSQKVQGCATSGPIIQTGRFGEMGHE
jgi:hypothetical protein